MEKSAYLLSEVDKAGEENRRLEMQANLFVDNELPLITALLSQGAKFADFGCGNGTVLRALESKRNDLKLFGFDADDRALQICRQAGEAGKSKIAFQKHVLGSGSALEAGSLDMAFIRLVLLHLPRPQAALEEMANCLRPDGLLYTVDGDDSLIRFKPALSWQSGMLDILEKVQQALGGSRRIGGKLGALISQAGLKPVGKHDVVYSKSVQGTKLFASLFLPVISFYLTKAGEMGIIGDDEKNSRISEVHAFMHDESTEMEIALCHVWGRKAA